MRLPCEIRGSRNLLILGEFRCNRVFLPLTGVIREQRSEKSLRKDTCNGQRHIDLPKNYTAHSNAELAADETR